MVGLRGVPKNSYPRCHVYSVGGTPTPLQLVSQYHGNQDGKGCQDEQHDRHRHPPVRRSPTYATRRTRDGLFPNCPAPTRRRTPGRGPDADQEPGRVMTCAGTGIGRLQPPEP